MYALASQSNIKCSRCVSSNNKCVKCRSKEYKNCSPPYIICNNCGMLDHLYCSYRAPELILEEKMCINNKTIDSTIDSTINSTIDSTINSTIDSTIDSTLNNKEKFDI